MKEREVCFEGNRRPVPVPNQYNYWTGLEGPIQNTGILQWGD